MVNSDLPAFRARLDAVSSILSRGRYVPDAVAGAVFFRALSAYPLVAVLAAFDAHVSDPDRGRFSPLPADIIAKLEQHVADDGRPGAEEAWALAMRSSDEADTIVWTAEAAAAMGVCRPILAAGDEVGARMAFREAYTRLVDAARRARIAPKWTPSLGHDPERRDRAIAEAAQRGLIDAELYPSLPAPRGDAPLLLSSEAQSGIPDSARVALRALRDHLQARDAGPSADSLARAATAAAQAETRSMLLTVDETVALVEGMRQANPELLGAMQRRAETQHLPPVRGAR